MASFNEDTKWMEAKRAIGDMNWIEIVSYYRSIDGENVFVYSVLDGDRRLIIDVIDDDLVLLMNSKGEPVSESYESVMNSRKVFKYSKDTELHSFHFDGKEFKFPIESYK